MDQQDLTLRCSSLFLPDGSLLEVSGVRLRAGRIAEFIPARAESGAAAGGGSTLLDLGDCLLTPGLINAHAHLDLSALRGRLPAGAGFFDWVGQLMQLRGRIDEQVHASARTEAARELLATGTTTVGDIRGEAAPPLELGELPLRLIPYLELIDAGVPERLTAGLRRAQSAEALSPHSPYSASPALLKAARELAGAKSLPVSIHWAETPEELEWLSEGSGPLAAFLVETPRCSGLELLREAGYLDPQRGFPLSLVHGNLPGVGELEALAGADVSLVHCPGTHRFFGRPAFDAQGVLDRGVDLALGTDSLASNEALDLGREMGLLRRMCPGLSPGRVLRMATSAGARALGLEAELGILEEGARADLCLWPMEGGAEDCLEAITSGELRPAEVISGGLPLGLSDGSFCPPPRGDREDSAPAPQ